MSELFSIQLQNRQQQGRDGVWLDLPTTTEQVQAALRQIGISSDNPQGLFVSGYFAEEEKRFAIPYNMVLASSVDELNFLAARLETLSAGERAELNAALQAPQSELSSIGKITDFPENVDYYVHLPEIHGPAQLGDYYLNRSGMVDMPEEWKGGIDTAQFGRYVAQQEQGVFTQYGYAVCQHYGLDTSEYSFGYVAGWSSGRELAELKASLEIIRSAAHELISALDEHLAELRQQREANLSVAQEAAFALDDGSTLFIQTCDSGYDYTLYDADKKALDGGQLDSPGLTLPDAGQEALNLLGQTAPVSEVILGDKLRCQHIGIFSLQHFIRKLPANLVGLLRRGFARRKRLYQVVGQIVAFLHGL